MKRATYILILFFIFGKIRSQGIGSITVVNGSFITTVDTVTVKIDAGFASSGAVTSNSYSFSGSVISNTINGCTGGLSSTTAIEENLKIYPLPQGTYKVKITLNEYDNFIYPGCNVLKSHHVDSITFNVVTYTGLEEISPLLGSVRIYPNPTADKLHLTFEDNPNDVALTIINYLNQEIYFSKNILTEQFIDVSFLSSGIYYLKIKKNNGQRTYKFFKE